tara:strand:- start:34 stop:702 length:669 start_codon:yes stop_codon:yes gene_type:complete
MAIRQVFPLFPTGVGVYNFGKEYHEVNKQLVKDIFEEQKVDPVGHERSNMGGWHGRMKMEQRYDSFKILRLQIEDCVNDFVENIGFKDGLVIENLWANINNKGDMNMGHHHGRSACTGVYYPINEIVDGKHKYEYAENVSLMPGSWDGKNGGSLCLQDPSYGQKIQLEKSPNPSPYTLEFLHVYPVAGVLIVMPSHLIHHVTPFKEDKTRISISFVCKYGTN